MSKILVMMTAVAVLAMSVPVQADAVPSTNYDWWVQHYADRLAALTAQDVALPAHADDVSDLLASPEFEAHVARVVARSDALGLDLATIAGGTPEEGGFPVFGDIAIISDYFHVVPAPPTASCNHPEADQHYDNIYVQMFGGPMVGDATDTWPSHSITTNLAIQLPVGHYGGVPNAGLPPSKTFTFHEPIYYVGESDFWCESLEICFFGFCYYEELNFPYVRGYADKDYTP